MDKRAELLAIIDQKENQLHMAENESKAWNKGKNKNSSNAQVSKIYVESLCNEIVQLKTKYETLNNS